MTNVVSRSTRSPLRDIHNAEFMMDSRGRARTGKRADMEREPKDKWSLFFSQLFFVQLLQFLAVRIATFSLIDPDSLESNQKAFFFLSPIAQNSFAETLIMHFCSRSEESYEGRRNEGRKNMHQRPGLSFSSPSLRRSNQALPKYLISCAISFPP